MRSACWFPCPDAGPEGYGACGAGGRELRALHVEEEPDVAHLHAHAGTLPAGQPADHAAAISPRRPPARRRSPGRRGA
jgi:hypothetical protein